MSDARECVRFFQATVDVVENVPLARDTFRVRLRCPEIARAIRPGQFLMLRLTGTSDPLLGRPFALYDTALDEQGTPRDLDVVYLVVGKQTRLLAALTAADRLEVWGPLGNGFPTEEVDHLGLVAGGIGQTPFLAHVRQVLGTRGYGGQAARQTARRVSLFYGVRSAELAAGVDDFRAAGADVQLASDDGSLGFHGFVTQLLDKQEPLPGRLIGCGPEGMMHALARLADSRAVPCLLSLESPMACGVGICFSCVTRVHTDDGGWDYRRICVDGPVFDARKLAWSNT